MFFLLERFIEVVTCKNMLLLILQLKFIQLPLRFLEFALNWICCSLMVLVTLDFFFLALTIKGGRCWCRAWAGNQYSHLLSFLIDILPSLMVMLLIEFLHKLVIIDIFLLLTQSHLFVDSYLKCLHLFVDSNLKCLILHVLMEYDSASGLHDRGDFLLLFSFPISLFQPFSFVKVAIVTLYLVEKRRLGRRKRRFLWWRRIFSWVAHLDRRAVMVKN